MTSEMTVATTFLLRVDLSTTRAICAMMCNDTGSQSEYVKMIAGYIVTRTIIKLALANCTAGNRAH